MIRMQQRRDTQLEWKRRNPILLDGEIGYERDTHQMKVGDGQTNYNDLPYLNETEAGEGTSLALLYENAKV